MSIPYARKTALLILAALVVGGMFLLVRTASPKAAVVKEQEASELATATVSIMPERIIQGDPVLISVMTTSTPVSVSLDGKALGTFARGSSTAALAGIDLNATPGTSTVRVVLGDGTVVEKEIAIEPRKSVVAPLGIPEKLGGNTEESAQRLVNTLEQENATLVGLLTAGTALWQEAFRYPLDNSVVTDEYGYSRQTGSQTIAHKGTDLRAPEGTVVRAMNRGVVRVAREYRNYGKTLVIDHGLGVMTFYMHLSRLDVGLGEEISKSQAIGLSGQTGYADEPHLHLTVRINDVSIDPVEFLSLFTP